VAKEGVIMSRGYLCLVLHAHLPFIRHPEHADFLEEDWFYEGMTETYLPLLDIFERLIEENIDFRITINLSPTLCAMMSDPLLCGRYRKRLDALLEFSEKEVSRTRNDPRLNASAVMYRNKFRRCRELFVDWYHGNIISAFRKFQDSGKIEIITCAATHGFLPLMFQTSAQRAQVSVGVSEYVRHFGRRPRGIWLPECAYAPGLDSLLGEAGLRYFFLETHGIVYGSPRPAFGVYAPVYCPSGVAAFSRDTETAHQVWSAEQGYPGDPDYREFFRDAGYDLDYAYVKPYLHADGERRGVGVKYHRVTGRVPLSDKDFYSPSAARDKAAQHAGHFMFNRERQIEYLSGMLERPPIVVAMYDAELFGHWWYEGIDFLDFLFRKARFDQNVFQLITPSEYLARHPENQQVQPCASSWGDKGYYEVWLNGMNDWVYRHLHVLEERMAALARRCPAETGLKRRALNQAAREVLLAQSSDWAFLMTAGTAGAYARRRTETHVGRTLSLFDQIESGRIDPENLKSLEEMDNLFPEIDYHVYSDSSQKEAQNV
jgi:1,4-alpha-glucan branching enzyme